MYIPSSFVFVSLLALLVSDVLAATLYRGDSRSPQKIHSTGGFKSKGSGTTLLQHATKMGGDQRKDSFISTTTDKSVAQKFAGGKGYVYTIDSTKITKPIHNLATELGKEEPHPKEKEQSVEGEIPYAAITKVEQGGTIVGLSRRTGEFVVADADQDEADSAQNEPAEADQEELERV